MMSRRERRRSVARAARWIGPAACAAAIALFSITRERVLGFDTRPLSVAVYAGRVTIASNARMTGQNGWICQDFHADLSWWFWWRFELRPSPMGVVMVPLWVVSLAGAVATAWGWRVSRRESTHGCERCGYDLRGLAAGAACPECGPLR